MIELPKLELCAAELLANLVSKVVDALDISQLKVIAWSDSLITLHWINSPSIRWRTFVANRVTKIQEITSPSQWRFVDGNINPVDCATRGMLLNDLKQHSTWWNVPMFLQQEEDQWPRKPIMTEFTVKEMQLRKPIKLFNIVTSNENDLLF